MSRRQDARCGEMNPEKIKKIAKRLKYLRACVCLDYLTEKRSDCKYFILNHFVCKIHNIKWQIFILIPDFI